MLKSFDVKAALQRMSQGDKSAFREIYNRYYGGIFLVGRKYLKSDELAKDLVHEVFLILLEKKNFTTINQFEFYLHVIARNKCIDYLKKLTFINKANHGFVEENGQVDQSRERAEHLHYIEDLEKQMLEAIDQLPPKRREIFVMQRIKGLSYDVIAKHFNISVETVHSQLTKGKNDLVNHLKQHLGSYIILSCLILE